MPSPNTTPSLWFVFTSCLYIYIFNRRKTAIHTDERVKVMNEIIAGMRVIKMYCWEKPFGDLVKKLRRWDHWVFILIQNIFFSAVLNCKLKTNTFHNFLDVRSQTNKENMKSVHRMLKLSYSPSSLKQHMHHFYLMMINILTNFQRLIIYIFLWFFFHL